MLATFLPPERVFLNQAPSPKPALLRDLAKRAGEALSLSSALIETALMRREDLGSTAIGGGVALPHAHLAEIDRPFGMVVRLRSPVDFAAVDDRPVDLVFLLLLPANQNEASIKALACVARKLRDSESLRRIRGAPTAEDMYRALVR